MLTFSGFTGINNVVDTARLVPDKKTGVAALVEAMNVDIGLTGEIQRRQGFSQASATCHKNVSQADGFMLATADSDLINVASLAVLYASLGVSRVWYTPLPDGRCTFSNGLICGVTDGTIAGTTKWGVPLPASAGAADAVAGSLMAGRYRWQVHHVRTRDGLEGGPTYGGTIDLAAASGIVWTALPTLAGHSTRVYLTSHDDETAYLAGTTSGSSLSFTAANNTLTLASKTDNLYPAPAGILTAFWRGRTLLASGNLLIASRNQQWELFDLAKDFKAFSGDLTLVQPVDDGIWVGTDKELAFLSGTQFDSLGYRAVVPGPVVLGSGVEVDAANIKGGNPGKAMIAIAGGGYLYAGFSGGNAVNLTDGVYTTDVAEVAATFRMERGIPQYIAIEQ